jgi:hypothetical protein
MTTTQINKLKSLIKGMSADVRNIQSKDFEALDSMRRTLILMSEVVTEAELELQPEQDEAIAA